MFDLVVFRNLDKDQQQKALAGVGLLIQSSILDAQIAFAKENLFQGSLTQPIQEVSQEVLSIRQLESNFQDVVQFYQQAKTEIGI